MALESFKQGFHFRRDRVHLNNAGVAPLCRASVEALKDAAESQAREGFFGVEQMVKRYEEARSTFAKLVNARAEDTAMMQTCAAALSHVALGLRFRAGDEILQWDQEYPSNAYPWIEAARRSGAVRRTIASEKDFSVSTEKMIAAISPRTKAVAVSWVQFQTGAMTDLKNLSEACHRVGAWLVVDVIQGVGAIPFDMKEMGVDAVCGGTHKWLCGPLGHGFLALAPGRLQELSPLMHGTFTYGTPDDPVDEGKRPRAVAACLEPGSPLYLGALGGGAAAAFFMQTGISAIHAESLKLADLLIERVRSSGGTVLSQCAGTLRSPIVTFIPRGDVGAFFKKLDQRGVSYAKRAGGVRLSPHAFNTRDDLEAVFECLV